MSKEYTPEEIRSLLIENIWASINFWSNCPSKTKKEALAGIAHSILVTLDGGSELPAFLVTPIPHEDDKDYCVERGEDYFPKNKPDLGSLHEFLYEKRDRTGNLK